MKDIIRSLSLKALKRFANGGDCQADLLMQIEDLRKTIEIRTKENEEHLTEVREERDYWLAQYDEVKFAAEFCADNDPSFIGKDFRFEHFCHCGNFLEFAGNLIDLFLKSNSHEI